MHTLEYFIDNGINISVSNPDEIKEVVRIFEEMGAIRTWSLKDHEDLTSIYLWNTGERVEVHGDCDNNTDMTYEQFIFEYQQSQNKQMSLLRKLNASRFA
jgi:hypothetical protein